MFLKYLLPGAVLAAAWAPAVQAEIPNITCEQIGAAIGAPITEMRPDPSAEPAWIDNPDAYQIICSWVTEPAFKMMQGALLSEAELADMGQVSAQLFVYKDLGEISELRQSAPKHPLPQPSTEPDVWVFALEPKVDYGETAGPMPPQLFKAGLATSIGTMPLLMMKPSSFGALTKGWSIEAGMRVIEMAEELCH